MIRANFVSGVGGGNLTPSFGKQDYMFFINQYLEIQIQK